MKTISFIYLALVFSLVLSACGPSPAEIATQTAVAETMVVASWTVTPTLTPTSTFTPTATATQTPIPDPCLRENLPDSLETFNEVLIRFDNVSTLGFYQTRKQLSDQMPELQNLRHAAQDQPTPPCLETLKELQLKYMDLVIKALTAFIDGKDMVIIRNTVINARKERDEYSQEMMNLLNSTPTPETK